MDALWKIDHTISLNKHNGKSIIHSFTRKHFCPIRIYIMLCSQQCINNKWPIKTRTTPLQDILNVINLVPYWPICTVPEQKRYMLHYVSFRPIYHSVPASFGPLPRSRPVQKTEVSGFYHVCSQALNRKNESEEKRKKVNAAGIHFTAA